MFKRMTLLRRLPADDTGQFCAHWANVHGALVLRLPGIRRYVQNDILDAAGPCDGIVELWFDDEPALRSAFASAQGRALPADEANFLGGKIVCDVEERVIGSPAAPDAACATLAGTLPGAAAPTDAAAARDGATKLISVVHSGHAEDREAWEAWHTGIARTVRPTDFGCTRMSVHRVVSMQRVGSEADARADLFAFVVYHFATPQARARFLDSGRADGVERLTFDPAATHLRLTVRERVLMSTP